MILLQLGHRGIVLVLFARLRPAKWIKLIRYTLERRIRRYSVAELQQLHSAYRIIDTAKYQDALRFRSEFSQMLDLLIHA